MKRSLGNLKAIFKVWNLCISAPTGSSNASRATSQRGIKHFGLGKRAREAPGMTAFGRSLPVLTGCIGSAASGGDRQKSAKSGRSLCRQLSAATASAICASLA